MIAHKSDFLKHYVGEKLRLIRAYNRGSSSSSSGEEGGRGNILKSVRFSNRQLSLVQRFSLVPTSQEREREAEEEEKGGDGDRPVQEGRKAHGMVLFWFSQLCHRQVRRKSFCFSSQKYLNLICDIEFWLVDICELLCY